MARLFYLLVFLFSADLSYGDNVPRRFVIDTSNVSHNIGSFVYYSYDSLSWKPLSKINDSPGLINEGTVVWYKLEVENTGKKFYEYLLDFKGAEAVVLYEEINSHTVRHINGKNINKDQRSYRYKRKAWIRLISGPLSTKSLFAKVTYAQKNIVPEVILYDAEHKRTVISFEKYVEGTFLGALHIIAIINLMLFFSTRVRTYLPYIGYVLSLSLLFVAREKIMFEFLSSGWCSMLNDLAIYIIPGLIALFYLAFINSYLNLKTDSPLWYKANKIFIIISLSITVILVLTKIAGYSPPHIVFRIWGVLLYFILNILAIQYCLKRYKPAYLLLAGNVILFIGLSVTLFYGIDSNNAALNLSLEIATVLQLIVFSKGIGDRLKIERAKRQSAQSRAMAMLEEKVQERTAEVVQQKEIVERKNRSILDSINYAKRIQSAILPPHKLVQQYIEESFILFKPKAIVAGDFYWMETIGSKVFFTAADCTGHGVPGAMISVMCSNALSRAVKEMRITTPAKILDKAVELLEEHFSKSDDDVRDGMDLGLCCLDMSAGTIEYAGAYNPLYCIRNGELKEIKSDRQPIGRCFRRQPYTNHLIKIRKGDCFYLSSDGYADQFGGPEGKKFRYSNFRKLLLEIHKKPMSEQKEILDATIEKWKNGAEQVDDICVMGIRV